jgi:hypothetical protein
MRPSHAASMHASIWPTVGSPTLLTDLPAKTPNPPRRARTAVAAFTKQALVDLQNDDDEMLRGVDWSQARRRSHAAARMGPAGCKLLCILCMPCAACCCVSALCCMQPTSQRMQVAAAVDISKAVDEVFQATAVGESDDGSSIDVPLGHLAGPDQPAHGVEASEPSLSQPLLSETLRLGSKIGLTIGSKIGLGDWPAAGRLLSSAVLPSFLRAAPRAGVRRQSSDSDSEGDEESGGAAGGKTPTGEDMFIAHQINAQDQALEEHVLAASGCPFVSPQATADGELAPDPASASGSGAAVGRVASSDGIGGAGGSSATLAAEGEAEEASAAAAAGDDGAQAGSSDLALSPLVYIHHEGRWLVVHETGMAEPTNTLCCATLSALFLTCVPAFQSQLQPSRRPAPLSGPPRPRARPPPRTLGAVRLYQPPRRVVPPSRAPPRVAAAPPAVRRLCCRLPAAAAAAAGRDSARQREPARRSDAGGAVRGQLHLEGSRRGRGAGRRQQ